MRAAQEQSRGEQAKGQPLDLERDAASQRGIPDTFEDLESAKKSGGLFGKVNAAFQDALQTGRGTPRTPNAVVEAADKPEVTADDLAIRRAKTTSLKRMTVPEGVIIEGSLTSGSETEIAGRVEGNVTVEGRLFLDPSALITGNIRADYCKLEGLVDGKVECSQELDLGETGRLNGDIVSGKAIRVAGQVFGNVATAGALHLASTAKLVGDVRVRSLVIEEGGAFNGSCAMRTPAQREGAQ
ncbi:MAG TPA: polymer-forming cytoskeletal protein [Candidatus Hydrogenedentes bacterium]|nr:polymer-forming cytoskeletal protein [Candidatus Hydrogenedentota bacterium]HPG68708.1 polymer-forming cytoskeletal protein [Candidatus Hydrogenedentota bacterium]